MTPGSHILVVGRTASIMAKVQALLASDGCSSVPASTDQAALAAISGEPFDALLIGGGVEPASRGRLVEAFAAAHPGRPVIEHLGGPHGLLEHVRQRLGRAP